MEAHYTLRYLEVALKVAVEDLKKQVVARSIAETKAAETPAVNSQESKTESPQSQQLRAQIHDDEIIRVRAEEQAHLKQQIADYEQRLH